jgi:hypothetical protein
MSSCALLQGTSKAGAKSNKKPTRSSKEATSKNNLATYRASYARKRMFSVLLLSERCDYVDTGALSDQWTDLYVDTGVLSDQWTNL